MNLSDFNPHWKRGYRYPFEKHRTLFRKLQRKLTLRQILQITGLRRTGKTTLLFQLINHLLEHGQDAFSLWYFSFDEAGYPLDELLHTFVAQTKVDFKTQKVFVFLDEIQKLPNFQTQIKVFYDLYPNLKFVISGSSSLFIRKQAQESLAGRVFQYTLGPLSFEEYLVFTDQTDLVARPTAFQREIYAEFELYLQNQFIESLSLPDDETKREYYVSIIRKILFEDIPTVFPVNQPEVLWQIVRIIGQRPGMLLEYQTLAADLNISRDTVTNYLFFLEESYLIRRFYNFSRNLLRSEKKLKKSYLASASFSWALAPFQDIPRLVENTYASLHNCRFFWRDALKHEIDFVEVQDQAILPVEIKYKSTLQRRDLKNLFLFARRFGVRRARVYTKVPEPVVLDFFSPDLQIDGIPAFQM